MLILEQHSNCVKMVPVTTQQPRTPRRTEALTLKRIIEAAVQVLDGEGESALTFRTLTTRLSTGAGAIYHHVANKNELLAAAADGIIGTALAENARTGEPQQAIRAIALGIFNAIDAHPWLGAQLPREPWQPAVLRIWTALGIQLDGLGISGQARSDAGAALLNYVLGSAAQYAAGARQTPNDADRAQYLEQLASRWKSADSDPLTREMASLLRDHDDRAQFLAGVDIFLAGIKSGSA